MRQLKNVHVMNEQFPEKNKNINHLSMLENVIVTLHILTALTIKMVALQRFRQVQSCMDFVSHLYVSGNKLIKYAVEQVFIKALPPLQLSCTPAEWNVVKAIMPHSLLNAYLYEIQNQVVNLHD